MKFNNILISSVALLIFASIGAVSTNANASHVMKSRFRTTNSSRLLKKSGFFNGSSVGGRFIFNKYAPNSKRAYVPKNVNVYNLGWLKGKFGQKNPPAYYYKYSKRGWIQLNTKKNKNIRKHVRKHMRKTHAKKHARVRIRRNERNRNKRNKRAFNRKLRKRGKEKNDTKKW